MEIVVIVAVVIGIAWFAVPKLAARRRIEDDIEARGGLGMGMLSWLPAWMIIGGAVHGGSDGNPGDVDAGNDFLGGFGGGGDHFGGGDAGGFGGGAD